MITFVTAARSFLGLLFAVAVVGKTHRPGAFDAWRQSLKEVPLVPRRAHGAVALAVPGAEALAVAALLLDRTAAAGLLLCSGLLALFAGATASALSRGSRPRCRCFGDDGGPLTAGSVRWNALLAAAAALVGVCALALGGAARPAAPVAVLTIGSSALAVLVVTRWRDVQYLLAPHSRARS